MNPGRLGPLLTLKEFEIMRAARDGGAATVECSLDLRLSMTTVELAGMHWAWNGQRFPYPERCKERTIYHWDGVRFETAARYGSSLVKLVPTDWGPPTFEIDGIKMLPTAVSSPHDDARRKVALIRPNAKVILDTCGGLGYFAHWCLQGRASHIHSFEKNTDVLWLRSINPWSPSSAPALTLRQGDIADAITSIPRQSIDAILHDPPRFGIAGELYSQDFYGCLARVMRPRGALFHYTGAPNKLSSGRDLAIEVANRLRDAGFSPKKVGDGILAIKQ